MKTIMPAVFNIYSGCFMAINIFLNKSTPDSASNPSHLDSA